MPKTNAEYCRDYRRKRRENKINKKTAKSSTERVREFRARRKALLNDSSITHNDDFTVEYSESYHNESSSDDSITFHQDRTVPSSHQQTRDTTSRGTHRTDNDADGISLYNCTSCKNVINRLYTCVQCSFDMCGTCDAAGVHSHHYVLRIPEQRPQEEVILILKKIRSELIEIANAPSSPVDENSDDEEGEMVEIREVEYPEKCMSLTTDLPPSQYEDQALPTRISNKELGDVCDNTEPSSSKPQEDSDPLHTDIKLEFYEEEECESKVQTDMSIDIDRFNSRTVNPLILPIKTLTRNNTCYLEINCEESVKSKRIKVEDIKVEEDDDIKVEEDEDLDSSDQQIT